MSKLQTYISERKSLFRDKFGILTNIGIQCDEVLFADIESFNEETIEGCLAIVREVVGSTELKVNDKQLDQRVVKFFTDAVEETKRVILQALNTKE